MSLSTIRDILVHVDGSVDGRARVRYALALARLCDAHLTCVHVTPRADPPPLYRPSQIDAATDFAEQALARDNRAASEIFRRETIGLSYVEWLSLKGDIAKALKHRAAFADLVIVGQYEWQGEPVHHPLPVSAELATGCGRPVLVLPAGLEAARFDEITIAWDGSKEAVRAVHDAMAFLQLASRVFVETIPEPGASSELQLLVEHLSRHGVHCEPRASGGGPQTAFEELFSGKNCDLVVMGAYSHSKWRELLFGGTTHSALMRAAVPILLSH